MFCLYFFYFKKAKDNEDEEEEEFEDRLLKNYTFKAEYNTEANNTNVSLAMLGNGIIEIIIDGNSFYNTSNFTFNNSGNHTVYILVDLEKIDSLGYFFLGMNI